MCACVCVSEREHCAYVCVCMRMREHACACVEQFVRLMLLQVQSAFESAMKASGSSNKAKPQPSQTNSADTNNTKLPTTTPIKSETKGIPSSLLERVRLKQRQREAKSSRVYVEASQAENDTVRLPVLVSQIHT